MNKPLLCCLVLALASAGAYHLGQLNPSRADTAAAQGRGPSKPAPKVKKTPKKETPLVFGESGSTGASANGFIAVTGSYGVGTSVLYLIDTVNGQISVYEARGGTQSMRRLVWVGARRIHRDLEVLGYRDESEYSFRDLDRMFQRQQKGAAGGNLAVPDSAGGVGTSGARRNRGKRPDRDR